MDKGTTPITVGQIKSIMPHATDENIRTYLPYLNETMQRFDIDTTLRQCHFLAQLAVESGSLCYVRELASGEAYEGREDLGNVCPGDGVKFKGRNFAREPRRKRSGGGSEEFSGGFGLAAYFVNDLINFRIICLTEFAHAAGKVAGAADSSAAPVCRRG